MWRPEPGPWTPTDQPSASGLGGTGGHVAGALTPFPCREHCWGARSPQGTIRTLAMCCSNEAPSGPARGPLGGQAAGVGAWPDQQRLPVGTSRPPRAQESGTQSPPWVTLSFVQQQRQRGEQGAPSQEPLNRSRGQGAGVLRDLERGVCQKPGQAGSPPHTARSPARSRWWPGAQGWPGAEGHPQALGAPQLGGVNGSKHSVVGIKHTREIPKPEPS